MVDSQPPRDTLVLPFVFYGIKTLDIEPRILFSVQIAWGRNANVKLRRHLHHAVGLEQVDENQVDPVVSLA